MTKHLSHSTVSLVYFSTLHFVIDCLSIFIVLSVVNRIQSSTAEVLKIILLYNFLAFATQWFFGWQADRRRQYHTVLSLSLFLAIISLSSLPFTSFIPIILIGLANAMNHIGAGGLVLQDSNYQAWKLGVFVAPGALGLLIGSKLTYSATLILILVLVVFGILLINLTIKPAYKNAISNPLPQTISNRKYRVFVLLLLMSIVVIRALVGGSISFTWKTQPSFFLLLPLTVFIGKFSGGFIADKYRFIPTGIISLLLAAIGLYLGQEYPFAGLTGIALFQITMPITLALIYQQLPTHPGLSLGLTTLSLFIGSLPSLLQSNISQHSALIMIVESIILLWLSGTIISSFSSQKKLDNMTI